MLNSIQKLSPSARKITKLDNKQGEGKLYTDPSFEPASSNKLILLGSCKKDALQSNLNVNFVACKMW